MSMPKWRTLQEDKDRITMRLPIRSGWLYYVIEKGGVGTRTAPILIFVPKEKAP